MLNNSALLKYEFHATLASLYNESYSNVLQNHKKIYGGSGRALVRLLTGLLLFGEHVNCPLVAEHRKEHREDGRREDGI